MPKSPFTSFSIIQGNSKNLGFLASRDPFEASPNFPAVLLEFRWRV